jgi:Ser/Thr protein kinase RdoA (MazF antagonist)
MRKLAGVALADYDLDVTRIRLITNHFNGIFRVDTADGEKYVLRICRAYETPNGLPKLRSEAHWLAALRRETDIPAPEPLTTRDGKYATTVQAPEVPEPRHCVLFTWLPGRDVGDDLSPQTLAKLGALMARLHVHAASWTPPDDFDITAYDTAFPIDPLFMFDDAHVHLLPPERRAFFMETADRIQAAIDRLRDCGEPMRVLHADLHRWNVRMCRGAMSAFDFQELQWGWPAQDIGTSLYYYHGERDYPAIYAAFQRGYTQVAPWPEREPGEIDLFVAARGMMLANSLLMDEDPEWRAEAPDYFATTEDRMRAIFAGELFEKRYW